MDSSRLFSYSRAKLLALALGIGIAGSLATAPASMATSQPPVGNTCQADGKINGGGSTFQAAGINDAFTYGYQIDVCGPQPAASNLYNPATGTTWSSPEGNGSTYTITPASWGSTDPSIFSFKVGIATNNVAGMVGYNWGASAIPTINSVSSSSGSGAGLEELSCRMNMFDGTDLPYNTAQLGSSTTVGLDGLPGSETQGSHTNAPWTSSPYLCDTFIDAGTPGTANPTAYVDGTSTFEGMTNYDQAPPPYGPQSYGAWPAAGDTTANAMGMPIAGGAVAFVANLTNKTPSSTSGGCTTTPAAGTALDLTPTEADDIWQGTINQWNDSVLDANNSFLVSDGCSGPIQRVVRQDNSGTTAITMFTLSAFEQPTSTNPNPNLCGAGSKGVAGTVAGTGQGWYLSGTASSNTGFWPENNGDTTCEDTNDAQGTSTPLDTFPNNPVNSANSGTPALVAEVAATPGGIGYGELGLWTATNGVALGSAGFPTASVATTAAPTTYVSPGSVAKASTCTYPSAPPVGAAAANAVGLVSTSNWSNTGSGFAPGHQDVADSGTGYPACGLTFDMVYTGQNTTAEVAAPSGSTTAATPGCTVTAPTPATTVAGQVFPVTTLNVGSTAGFPPSGTVLVDGQDLTYTGVTSTSFTGVTGSAAGVTTGSDPVSMVSTKAAATSTTPGINGACQTTADSVSGITNDQLRTLYSYFTYMFSPLGQDQGTGGASNLNLQNQTLDPLPAGWLQYLEAGFQGNF